MPSVEPLTQAARPIRLIPIFTDRFDWMGPVIVVLSSWYFAAQVLVAWVFRPQYSFVSNAISDLGNTACPPPNSNICSPRYVVMDASIAGLGLAMMVGSVLIFSEFRFSLKRRERIASIAGFACMFLGGFGAILVGAVQENVNTAHLHTVGTVMAIGFGQLAILILGFTLIDIDEWLRQFMIFTSLIVLLAGICIAGNHHFGIGDGALERLAQYPESVWLILFGLYITRTHYRTGVASRFRFTQESRLDKSAFLAVREATRVADGGDRTPPAAEPIAESAAPRENPPTAPTGGV